MAAADNRGKPQSAVIMTKKKVDKPEKSISDIKEEITKYVLGEVSRLLATLDFSKITEVRETTENGNKPTDKPKSKMAPKEKTGKNKPPAMEEGNPDTKNGEIEDSASTSAETGINPADSDEVISLKTELARCKQDIRELRSKVSKLEIKNKKLGDMGNKETAKVSNLPTATERKKNIIIRGVPEVAGEKLETTVGNFLETAGCSFDWTVVSRAYRLGRKRKATPEPTTGADSATKNTEPGTNEAETADEGEAEGENTTPKTTPDPTKNKEETPPRGIKLHLQNREQCQQIYGARTKINNKAEYKYVSMRPDSSRDDMMAERTVQQIYTLAKTNPKVTSAKMRGKSIEINGVLYRECDLDKIEIDGISPTEAAIREFDWGTCFQGHNAPLSNFYRCEIKNKMGSKTFTSAEQYYCSVMANYHEQFETQRLIEATENPYAIKAIAKRIRRKPEWYARSERVLADIVRAKFDQNPELKKKLIAYRGAVFRECTKCPYWGAGIFLSQATSTQTDISGYKNSMGKILENVRDAYRQQNVTTL